MAEYIELEAAIDAVTNVYYNTPDINLSADKLEVSLRRIPMIFVATAREWAEVKNNGEVFQNCRD